MTESLVGPAPDGMPDPDLVPPQIARGGDTFSALRIVHFVSRLHRNRTHQLRDVVVALNAEFLDWSFSEKVVLAEIVQLQANWGISFHGDDRIVLDRNERGHTILVTDSTKMTTSSCRRLSVLRAPATTSFGASPSATGSRRTGRTTPRRGPWAGGAH